MQVKTKKIVQVNDKLIALKNENGDIEIYEKVKMIINQPKNEIENMLKELEELEE